MASRGPQMLKEFLAEESDSWSPKRRALTKSPIAKFKAASAAIAAIHRASEIFFNTVKSAPSALPRSISRKLSKPRRLDSAVTVAVVQVKDILRWKSFRDLVDEPPSLDLSPSTATMSTSGSSNSNSSTRSSGSSWCHSDFTEDHDIPYYQYTTADLHKESYCSDDEQFSPISTLNFPFQEEDCTTKQWSGLEQNNEEEEEEEEEGEGEEEETPVETCKVKYDEEHSFKLQGEVNKEACLRDMKAGGTWYSFDEEKEELAVDLEIEILNCLIDELFILV